MWIDVALPWGVSSACVVDAFGSPQKAEVRDGTLQLQVTDTPLFVSTAGLPRESSPV